MVRTCQKSSLLPMPVSSHLYIYSLSCGFLSSLLLSPTLRLSVSTPCLLTLLYIIMFTLTSGVSVLRLCHGTREKLLGFWALYRLPHMMKPSATFNHQKKLTLDISLLTGCFWVSATWSSRTGQRQKGGLLKFSRKIVLHQIQITKR